MQMLLILDGALLQAHWYRSVELESRLSYSVSMVSQNGSMTVCMMLTSHDGRHST